MARHLLKRQKNLIDKFIAENTHSKESFHRSTSVFTNNRHSLGVQHLSGELWEKLVNINDTEILYQEVNRYMDDKCCEIVFS